MVTTENLKQQLHLLLKLQTLDSERIGLERRRHELNESGGPVSLREAVAEAAGRLSATNERLSVLRRQARYWEQEAHQARSESTELERKMYGGEVSNLKELEQSEKRSGQLKTRAGELEDQVLGAMEEIETLDEDASEQSRELDRLQQELASAETEYERELIEIEARLKILAARREELLPGIEPAMLARYENLASKKAGVGIVVMKDNTCTGCRVGVPVILANRVRRSEEMIQCENCGRLLCYEE